MSNSISIIGCGETASQWDGRGMSIGVNDCWRFGKATNILIVVNSKKQFDDERLKYIVNAAPEHFYTHLKEWRYEFSEKCFKLLDDSNFAKWRGKLTYKIQHSKTSPFVAISLAYQLGYKEIKIYGADFNTHKVYSDDSKELQAELKNYKQLFEALKAKGVTITSTKESQIFKLL